MNRIKEGSITPYPNRSERNRATRSDNFYPEGEVTIANDFVLQLTGYKPNFGYWTTPLEMSQMKTNLAMINTIREPTVARGYYLAGSSVADEYQSFSSRTAIACGAIVMI